MSKTPEQSKASFIKIVGIGSLVLGILFVIAGIGTWTLVSSQLKDENITVSGDADFLAGAEVKGPFSAYAQAEVINKHALAGTGGLTYAELGGVVNQHKATATEAAGGDAELEELIDGLDIAGLQAAGASDEVIEATQDAAAAQAQRNSIMNGSFLRASLFTSVLAFGVSAMVIGLGVLLAFIGIVIRQLAVGFQPKTAVASGSAKTVDKE